MDIDIFLRKSTDQNASIYFEKSKKAKKKLEGAHEALEKSMKALEIAKLQKPVEQQPTMVTTRKREWYEKFRWFFSSTGKLVLLGRDATTNEIIIKKHTDKTDIVFHADVTSPFCTIKLEKTKLDKATKQEAAIATGSFSSAWKSGISSVQVFMVKPDQVTKEAKAGEYVPRGAFMIYGKKEYVPVEVALAIGKMEDGKLMCGPITAVKKHCKDAIQLYPGNKKTSDIAKYLLKKLEAKDLDEMVRVLPVGGLTMAT